MDPAHQTHNGVCPICGYCPLCGRGGHVAAPLNPYPAWIGWDPWAAATTYPEPPAVTITTTPGPCESVTYTAKP